MSVHNVKKIIFSSINVEDEAIEKRNTTNKIRGSYSKKKIRKT